MIVTNLAVKLNPESSVFVISNRHDAIEDLASEVQRFPEFELMELEQLRDRMPLRAGMHVTAVQGEHLYSWLVFGSTAENKGRVPEERFTSPKSAISPGP